MRPRGGTGIAVRVLVVLLASCTALTGVDELTTDDDGAPINLPSSSSGGSGQTPTSGDAGDVAPDDDGSVAVDASDGGADATVGPCNENGLIAHWKLDEGTGKVALDCSSNALDGTVNGGTWVQGKKALALAFDGGGSVAFGAPPLLSKTGAFTVMAWVRSEAVDAGTASRYIVGKTETAGVNGWRLATQSGQYAVSISGEAGVQTFGGSVVVGQWNHVAAVYIPGTAVEIYVDGQLLTRNVNAKSPALAVSDAGFHIGAKSDGTFPFIGVIDDVAFYDRALSAAEIAARAVP